MTPQPSEQPRTEAGRAMESWLREPEDYEWGRKVTAAILAIEAEAAASDPVATGEPMPMRMRTALSAFEAWAEAVIPMLENAGDTETAAYGRDRIEQSENARTTVRRWSAPDPVATPCTTCRHPYSEHTGRGLKNSRLVPEQARPGAACEHREDYHHTCSCSRYVEGAVASPAPLDVERLARAMTQAHFYPQPSRNRFGADTPYSLAAAIAAAYESEGQPAERSRRC